MSNFTPPPHAYVTYRYLAYKQSNGRYLFKLHECYCRKDNSWIAYNPHPYQVGIEVHNIYDTISAINKLKLASKIAEGKPKLLAGDQWPKVYTGTQFGSFEH